MSELGEDIPELRQYIDWEYYQKWAERKQRVPKIKETDRFKFEWDFKMPPFEHQRKALAFILNTPAQALFAETGTGKTYCGLVAAEMRYVKGLANKILVVAPASVLRTGWYEDMLKFTDLKGIIVHRDKWKWYCSECGTRHYRWDSAKKHMKKCGLDGVPDPELMWNEWDSVPDKLHQNEMDYQVYITSINLAHLYLEDFLAAGFDMMILDESTMIKNPSGEWTKSMRKLGWSCKYRLAMTGTPITNELEDIWGQMQFVDMPFSPTITQFRSNYYWQHPAHHYIRSPREGAAEKIADICRNSVLRIKKKDCLDLPERTTRVHEVTPSKEVQSQYKQFFNELWTRHKGETVVSYNVFTEILRLHQILNGYWTKPHEDGEVHVIDKVPAKAKYLKDEILPSIKDKVIVWTYYRHDARILKEVLSEYDPAIVNGETKNKDEEIKKFLEAPDCRVMLAHPRSAKFGHTWNVASTTVFYTYGYGVEDYWQARDRNYRIGQDKPVTEIILSCGGIEKEILASIVKKEDFSKKVMENLSPALRRLEL